MWLCGPVALWLSLRCGHAAARRLASARVRRPRRTAARPAQARKKGAASESGAAAKQFLRISSLFAPESGVDWACKDNPDFGRHDATATARRDARSDHVVED